jgi:hypothetical protein
MGFEESLLNQIRVVNLASEPTADLQPSQDLQIASVNLQKLALGETVPISGLLQQ